MNRIFISLILAVTLTLFGCSEEKVYRIGISQCSQDDWRLKMNEEVNREVIYHDDAEVEIRSADDSNEKQIADIQYFVNNDFDIIIVSPNEAAALTPVIKEVYESGMPVVIFDRNIIGDTYTARAGADDVGLGKSAAHYALHLLGKGGKALEIRGLDGSTPAQDRHKGFVEEFTGGGGEVVASVDGHWNEDDAISVVDSLLNIYSDVDLIYAHNDRMAIGASQVANRHGRKDIKVIGIDAAPNIGIQAVADGVLEATFIYPTEGSKIIQLALDILKGNPYERETIFPLSSAVDKSNADIFLLQNKALAEETSKMVVLKKRIDDYWIQHSTQTSLFYASVAIIVLLFGVAFLLLRAYWQRARHQKVLLAQNKLLAEQRDNEKRLNEQLQKATQSKLVFFTNVSHDLRTPLTLIAEPMEQLAKADNLTEEQSTFVSIANKNIRILQRLINQILDFRKYQAGKLELNLQETDFRKAVVDWCESFRAIAKSRQIKLEREIPDDQDFQLAIDQEKIERVFFNLTANAFKYTRANGKITLRCSCDGKVLTFSISDTGTGIPKESLTKIFEHFYQAEKIQPKGSGIGLWLARSFVMLHGGTLEVESELGKGSTFTVKIPVRHVAKDAVASVHNISGEDVVAELAPIEPENIKTDDGKPVLLVIDDNSDIRLLIRQLLGHEYNVIEAADGAAGLRMAAKYVPDLIICDVMMPVMDGMECCRRIKDEVSTSHIPVLMLTACSMDDQKAQGYESGADGYLSKPFNSQVLEARCRSLIDNRRRIKDVYAGAAPAAKSEDTPKAPLPQGDIDSDFYRRFLEIVDREIGNPDLNVDSLASMLGLGRSQFYRKIKALTNYSPVEILRDIRLKKARELLMKTEKTISEIAYEMGFSTPAYFTKCFKDAYDETPTDLRSRL